jgi:flagellin-like protein
MKKLQRMKDNAVSPVIGTIMMVAVTVVLGIAVFAAMAGYGDESVEEAPSTGFRASAVDTDGDGKTDAIRVTYITGPANLDGADVSITTSEGTAPTPATWSPGDFILIDGVTGPVTVTVAVLDVTVLDRTVAIDA